VLITFDEGKAMVSRPVMLTATVLAIGCVVAASFDPLSSVAVSAPAKAVGKVAPKPAARAAKSIAKPSFSHMVIVDQQRPGNEPDVKVNGKGRFFSSEPFGFSTASSFLWRSTDHGNSYQLVPGNIGSGKPSTCAGGGDTDLYIDPGDALYFSDLQGLTNISNSVSTNGGRTFTTTCSGAPNSPVDRMWFAARGSLKGKNLRLYQDYDQVGTSASTDNPGGNQLVETVSTDGTTFVPVTNPNVATTDCAGTAINCVTDNEGISGNQVVDPKTGNVFIAHTTTNGGSGSAVGVQVSEGRIDFSGPDPTGTWTESPNLDAALCPNTQNKCVDASGNATELAGENFASIARDSAGFLYVTFTAGPVDHKNSNDANFGQLTEPEQIYVVRSLQPATMTDPSKVTWSKPMRITGANRGISHGTNTFPWITAGSKGRIGVAWYHTATTSDKGAFGASALANAEWSVQIGESLNANTKSPTWRHAQVSDGPIKFGSICTNGIGCATGGDRSLGDFLQVSPDHQGAMLVTYVYDTSGNNQGGEDAGPEVISRQISGPGLYAGRTVTRHGGPGRPSAKVSDRRGDAYYSANGARHSADKSGAPRLDLTGASLTKPRGKSYLLATLRTRWLTQLTGNAKLGGPDASWMIRWTQLLPGKPGNGLIYYAGVDGGSSPGATPTFFMGTTSCIPANNPEEHCKFLTYPQTTTIKGTIDHKRHVIQLQIPRKALHLHKGSKLISVTAFTATAATPQSATTIFNLIDATTPFDIRAAR
jgi:hypothetical protein